MHVNTIILSRFPVSNFQVVYSLKWYGSIEIPYNIIHIKENKFKLAKTLLLIIDLLYCELVVTRSILNGNVFKSSVLAPIFNFSVQTGSRFPV